MLTIKKRYPRRMLFYYGGAGLTTGFAAIMALLVYSNANIDQFVSVAPTQPETVAVIPADTPDTAQETTEAAKTTSQTVVPAQQQPAPSGTNPSVPSKSTPTPEDPTPTQPVPSEQPSEPTEREEPDDPAEETPDDPGLIEEILDVIIPDVQP